MAALVLSLTHTSFPPRRDLPLDPHLAHLARQGARPPLRLGRAHHRAALVRPVPRLPREPVPAERDVPDAVRVPRRPADVNGLPRGRTGQPWVCDPAEPWTLCSNPAWGRGSASDYNSDSRLGEFRVRSSRTPRPPAVFAQENAQWSSGLMELSTLLRFQVAFLSLPRYVSYHTAHILTYVYAEGKHYPGIYLHRRDHDSDGLMLMEESLIPYAYACLFLYMFRAQSHEMYLYSPRMCPSRRTWISCISQRLSRTGVPCTYEKVRLTSAYHHMPVPIVLVLWNSTANYVRRRRRLRKYDTIAGRPGCNAILQTS